MHPAVLWCCCWVRCDGSSRHNNTWKKGKRFWSYPDIGARVSVGAPVAQDTRHKQRRRTDVPPVDVAGVVLLCCAFLLSDVFLAQLCTSGRRALCGSLVLEKCVGGRRQPVSLKMQQQQYLKHVFLGNLG